MNTRTLRINILLFIMIIAIVAVGLSAVSVGLYNMGEDVIMTSQELDQLKTPYPLTHTLKEHDKGCTLEYKVCNLITLKSVNIQLADNNKVYLGGKPLGLAMNVGGLIVTQKIDVVTDQGIVSPAKELDIETGDILIAVNGIKVERSDQVGKIVASGGEQVTLTMRRGEITFNRNITPAIDTLTKTRKLGLWMRDDIEGIGTLTYISQASGRYGALGHVIKDFDSGIVYNKPDGKIFDSTISGVVKGERGKAGELSGSFDKTAQNIGSMDTNCDFGVFGQYFGSTEGMEEITLGCKYSVRPGRAYIYTTISGEQPKRYEIEIIKNSHQSSAKTRGLLIRVTDKELLEKAGGIVQGMSGSPIIQNGKLIGAVTHVFVGDPTKGYGTYIDWMLPN